MKSKPKNERLLKLRFALAVGLMIVPLTCETGMAESPRTVPIPFFSIQPKTPKGEAIAENQYYDAYYDGSYGMFTDVYWGVDGQYWYLSWSGRAWLPDRQNHFRRTPAPGFALVRGSNAHREH